MSGREDRTWVASRTGGRLAERKVRGVRAGGRLGAQQALSRASLMAETPLRCEGLSPSTARVPVPREESRGVLALRSPVCPARSCLCVFRPAWSTEGWEPVRTALLGDLAQVKTAEADSVAAELKDFFLLLFLQPA